MKNFMNTIYDDLGLTLVDEFLMERKDYQELSALDDIMEEMPHLVRSNSIWDRYFEIQFNYLLPIVVNDLNDLEFAWKDLNTKERKIANNVYEFYKTLRALRKL